MNKHIVLVIGGPGKSGSSTIARMLSGHFNLERVYGGKFFRVEAKRRGFKSVDEFLKKASKEDIEKLDNVVDNKLRDLAKEGSVVIESKVFAALATQEDISCSAKIWIDADIDVRAKRGVDKEDIKNPIAKWFRRREIREELLSRYVIDSQRYKELYGIDYEHPEKYNDLVIDNSDQTPDQTFNLILDFLKNAGIKK
jgi:predicted cytidylate kinase